MLGVCLSGPERMLLLTLLTNLLYDIIDGPLCCWKSILQVIDCHCADLHPMGFKFLIFNHPLDKWCLFFVHFWWREISSIALNIIANINTLSETGKINLISMKWIFNLFSKPNFQLHPISRCPPTKALRAIILCNFSGTKNAKLCWHFFGNNDAKHKI